LSACYFRTREFNRTFLVFDAEIWFLPSDLKGDQDKIRDRIG